MTEVVFVNRKKAAPGWSDLFYYKPYLLGNQAISKKTDAF